MSRTLVLGVLAACGMAAPALAVSTLQFDVNGLSVQGRNTANTANMAVPSGPVGSTPNFTGRLNLSSDTNSNTGMFIDSVAQALGGGFTAAGFSFTGFISFNAGNVTGGMVTINSNGAPNSSYTATVSNIGNLRVLPSGERGVDGLLFNGLFGNLGGPAGARTFAGVNINPFITSSSGSYTQFAFGPDANGFDTDADIDIFIPIPLPGVAGMAGVGMLGVFGVRRRRA